MFPDTVLRLPATSQRSAGMADVFPLPPAFSGIKPHGIHIYEDLAKETMAKRKELLPKLKRAKEEGKIAYFSYDKLIIKDRPTSTNYSPG